MDKLKELEKESRELLSVIKSKADAENLEMPLPPLDIKENESKLFLRRRIPSWIAAAAMITGIAIGIALPQIGSTGRDTRTSFNYADTCRSVAQNDVNLSLLITSL